MPNIVKIFFLSHTLATGANDNLVLVWDDRNTNAPISTFNDHQAAIKAVAFCPWQPRTLATGGGSLDRHIRFWNLSTGNLINSIDTGSQVSSIVWSSEEYKELASAHGYSHNQVTVWKYPTMGKVADLQVSHLHKKNNNYCKFYSNTFLGSYFKSFVFIEIS